jgi:uncharacterized metal-binding protein
MPSGKTHDAITLLLAAPAAAIAFVLTRDFWLTSLVAGGFLFGGLMFGPDLDTASRQYSRWKFARFLWFPYRTFFKHRSRWSHGLIFGTLLRVVYFMGVTTCLGFGLMYFYSAYLGGELPGLWKFTSVWASLRDNSDRLLGFYGIPALFIGMWSGAASHTFTDIAGSYVKTGRVGGVM